MVVDVYRILATTPSVSDVELKKAWLLARSKHHPDKGGDAESFKKVNIAWDLVKTPQQRKAYDDSLKYTQNVSRNSRYNDFYKQYESKPTPQPSRQKTENKSYYRNDESKTSLNYEVTLKDPESARKVLNGVTFTLPAKSFKYILKLLPTYDEFLVIGKTYKAQLLGTQSAIKLNFNIKFKPPWSWDNKQGLTYTTSRVLKNVIKGGSLKIKGLSGNIINVKWEEFYPSDGFYKNGITLRIKGKGWPSENIGNQDLFIKIKPRKAPVKKAKKKATFW